MIEITLEKRARYGVHPCEFCLGAMAGDARVLTATTRGIKK